MIGTRRGLEKSSQDNTVQAQQTTQRLMDEYDFEEYTVEQGIPETLDHLPYRRAGSVVATGDEAEPVLTSTKHES